MLSNWRNLGTTDSLGRSVETGSTHADSPCSRESYRVVSMGRANKSTISDEHDCAAWSPRQKLRIQFWHLCRWAQEVVANIPVPSSAKQDSSCQGTRLVRPLDSKLKSGSGKADLYHVRRTHKHLIRCHDIFSSGALFCINHAISKYCT